MVLVLVHNIPGDFEASSTGNASLGGGDVAPIDLLRFLWPKLFARPVDSLLNFTINVEVVLKWFLSHSSSLSKVEYHSCSEQPRHLISCVWYACIVQPPVPMSLPFLQSHIPSTRMTTNHMHGLFLIRVYWSIFVMQYLSWLSGCLPELDPKRMRVKISVKFILFCSLF